MHDTLDISLGFMLELTCKYSTVHTIWLLAQAVKHRLQTSGCAPWMCRSTAGERRCAALTLGYGVKPWATALCSVKAGLQQHHGRLVGTALLALRAQQAPPSCESSVTPYPILSSPPEHVRSPSRLTQADALNVALPPLTRPYLLVPVRVFLKCLPLCAVGDSQGVA